MPNKENIQKWVEALESGKYKQGTSRLRRIDNSYCCLGVACQVALENGLEIDLRKDVDDYSYDRDSCTLPKKVHNWLGIINEGGYFGNIEFKDGSNAIRVNDAGMSFVEIAQKIRKTFLD